MPYKVGDKIVVMDIAANRQHARMRDLIGEELRVGGVADRHPHNIRDGKGLQNIKIVGDLVGNYNDYRFALVDAAIPVPVAAPVAIAIIDEVRREWEVGDVFVLTGDHEKFGPGWVEEFDQYAEDGIELTIISVDWENEWVESEDIGGRGYHFDMTWITKPVKELGVGDEVWYKQHCDETNKNMYMGVNQRPIYKIAEEIGGQWKIVNKEDFPVGLYDKDQWIAITEAKAEVAKKKEVVLDPVKQKEKLDKLLAEWTDTFAAEAHGCANFVLIKEKKNGELKVMGGVAQPCHYELRGGYDGGGGKPVAVMDSIHRRHDKLPKYQQQGFKDYVSYLLNRSPWANSYLTKDFDEANTKGIMMNLDVTANQLVGACIAMRQSSEFSSVLPVHAFLKAKRFSGDVCFLIGQHYTIDGTGAFKPITLNSGHTIMSSTMPADKVFKFFATKEFVGEAVKKPYRESQAYNNIFGTITGREEYARAKAGEVSIDEWMRTHCVVEEVGEGLKKKFVVTEASILKLARAVKAELAKHKAKEEVAA